MNRFTSLGAAFLLLSCGSDRSSSVVAPIASNGRAADLDPPAPGSSPAPMSLLNTSWEIGGSGSPMVISIDRTGAYIEERDDGTHVDHGTYAQRNRKDCFTSAMGDKGTNCWTTVPQVAIGGTASGTADDGNSGVFKRIEYRALNRPPVRN